VVSEGGRIQEVPVLLNHPNPPSMWKLFKMNKEFPIALAYSDADAC